MPVSTAWIDAFLSRERLPPQFRALIAEIHAPIAARLAAEARRRGGHLAAGLCGAQGSGKSTLAAVLKGRTVIAIAHRLYTAHDADRVAVVEDGRISA